MKPVLFELGPLTIYSYGVMIAIGGLLSCRFWRARQSAMGLKSEDHLWLLVNAILVGGFLGGRLLFVLEYTSPFSSEFWASLVSLSRGFSVLGAFGGVAAGVWWASRRAGAPFLRVLDYVCQAAPFWHAFGRVGCLLAGCCFGRPAEVPWSVTFTDPRAMVDAHLLGKSLHPTALYEAVGDLALAAFLYRVILPRVEGRRLPSGSVTAFYFAGYGVLRFIVEFYRGDVIPTAVGLTAGQGLSVLLALAGIGIYLYISRRQAAADLCTPS